MKVRFITLLFILVSIFDITITCYWLIWADVFDHMEVSSDVESNPIAREVITRFGSDGMVLFKTSLILLICWCIYKIHHKKPRTSVFVSALAFTITLYAALYGVYGLIMVCYYDR